MHDTLNNVDFSTYTLFYMFNKYINIIYTYTDMPLGIMVLFIGWL